MIEKKRIFKFLMGPNKNLDEVRGRVLGTKPLPSIREVFSEVRREESRKKVMMGESSTVPLAENSALAARGVQHPNNDNRQRKGRPWCDHCRKSGYTRETCWKIHSKPADWKPSRSAPDKESRGNHVTVDEESAPIKSSPFSKVQLEILQKMFSQQNPAHSTIGTSSLAHR